MSTPGPADGVPTPARTPRTPRTPRAPRGRRARRVRRVQGALLGAAVLATAIVVVDQARVTAPAARPYPSAWSRAAEPYAALVEAERGVAFDHPVHVDLLTPDRYDAQVAADRAELRHVATAGSVTDDLLAQVAPLLQATGLVRGDAVPDGGLAPALAATADADPLATQGYYSYRDQRIRIRGTALGPATSEALVHELAHALQDQHLDTGADLEAAARAAAKGGPDAAVAGAVRQAVLEGDALRVVQAYRAGLDPGRRQALARSDARRAQREATAVVSPGLTALHDARPRLATALVRLADRRGGLEAVDRLLASPPRSDGALHDPLSWRSDDEVAVDVPAPPAAAGTVEVTATGHAGALTWYAVLAQHLPLGRALAAADAIAGDAWSAYEIDGRACVSMSAGVDPGAVGELAGALDAWARDRPGAPVVVEPRTDGLTFSTCVPEGVEPPLRGGSTDRVGPALALAVARTGLVSDGRVPPGRPDAARCYVDAAVAGLEPDALVARPRPAGVEARLDALAARCLA